MRIHASLGACLLVLSLGAALPALAGDDCDVPIEHWQSRDAVMQMAARQGWQVERLKIDDGCYEIRGRDAQGRAFEAKLDPQTLGVVKMKQRDPERERSRERVRGSALHDTAPASGPPAPPPAAVRGGIE